MSSRKEYLRNQFEAAYGELPEALLGEDYEPSERDLELAVALDRDQLTSIALIIQAEEILAALDEDHLSEGSKDEIRSTEAKLLFSKKVECARYSMEWIEIRDLFLSGQYDVLDENYDEDWDVVDLENWDVETDEKSGGDTE
ncbi:hypothetical protein [Halomontanus rarus]|uniref:hypothetical protein n=1 Tax=Halomontanus rarus TaxID=3034020 RepID=UPI001A98B90F